MFDIGSEKRWVFRLVHFVCRGFKSRHTVTVQSGHSADHLLDREAMTLMNEMIIIVVNKVRMMMENVSFDDHERSLK